MWLLAPLVEEEVKDHGEVDGRLVGLVPREDGVAAEAGDRVDELLGGVQDPHALGHRPERLLVHIPPP